MTGKGVGSRIGEEGPQNTADLTVSAKPAGSFGAKVACDISSKFLIGDLSDEPTSSPPHTPSLSQAAPPFKLGPLSFSYFPSCLFPSQRFIINGNKKCVHHISATMVWPLPSNWLPAHSRPEEGVQWQPGMQRAISLVAMTCHLAVERSLTSCWIVSGNAVIVEFAKCSHGAMHCGYFS